MSLLNSLLSPRGNCSSGTCDSSETDTAAVQTVRPAYRVRETDDAFNVTVQLPGVSKDGLEVGADNGELTIVGRRVSKTPATWTPLYRESGDATFQLILRHDAAVDVEKVVAELRDGILTLSLPKNEALKPRKIAVS